MTNPVDFVEVWRGDVLENTHRGHAVVCDATGQIVQAWGDPNLVMYPRSACKMIQALPLIESGAAAAFNVTDKQLALACSSHQAETMHTDAVGSWLADLHLTDDAYRCGAQLPLNTDARHALIREGRAPRQIHNTCSGKHAGFLTLARHLKAGPEYLAIEHPVQQAFKAVFEDLTQAPSPAVGIDGCSAPTYATTLHGLARAMAYFAAAKTHSGLRAQAAQRLVTAMTSFPEMIAGTGQACTDLMRAMDGKAAIKFGADGVYTAILPDRGFGIALKITDGSKMAAECAIAALLVRLGVLHPDHPAAKVRMTPETRNVRGLVVGHARPTPSL